MGLCLAKQTKIQKEKENYLPDPMSRALGQSRLVSWLGASPLLPWDV